MIKIGLQPFILPAIDKLFIQNQGEPYKHEVSEGNFMLFRDVRYEIHDVTNVMREHGTMSIPETIYNKFCEFVMGDVSEETLSTLNEFFQNLGWSNLIAINLDS